jgi:hypothetical protein
LFGYYCLLFVVALVQKKISFCFGAGWNGCMLGSAQVPAGRADALVARLAALVRAAVTAAPASSPSSR